MENVRRELFPPPCFPAFRFVESGLSPILGIFRSLSMG
jgi:hypothetical protein